MVTITRAKTWVANETLTAAELNAEFDNINSELTSGDPVFESKLIVGVNDAGHDVQFFGAADGAYMLWDESANLLEIRGAAAAGPGHLKLTTAELTNVDGGILGRIDFQAPLDSAGTDAILVGASIWAEADATFSSSVNSTELVFATGTSETAAEKMRLTSDGTLRVASLFTTDIKIGEDDETKIDFETADEIHFYAANVEQVYLADNIFGPQSDSDVDLGTTGVRWKDAYVDSITVTGEVDGASLDISGNADIDGTTNLDAVDIDGAVQVDNTITVGVNGTGHDVKFWGDTADAYMLWDESTDDLVLGGAAQLYLNDAGGGEHISSDGTDLTINSGNNINLTCAGGDVVIPANIGLTFGSGEKIEGDSTDLTITSGAKINLTATSDIVVPADVGITFGTGEKIEGNNTDLTLTSGADIALTATGDVNIPSGVGVVFGDDGEKIEGDGTNLTIASSAQLIVTATQIGFGAAPNSRRSFDYSITHTASSPIAFSIRPTVVAASGSTEMYRVDCGGSMTTGGASNTYDEIVGLRISEPTITNAGGDTITKAVTLQVAGVATEATTNWAIEVTSGNSYFGGDIDLAGNRIDLDTDNDSSIRCSADDTIDFEAGGQDALQLVSGTGITTTSLILNTASNQAARFWWYEADTFRYHASYDGGGNKWVLSTTDSDGGGTDDDIIEITDGTNDVKFAGGISLDDQSAPTSGLVLNGDIDLTTTGNRIDFNDANTTSMRAANTGTLDFEILGTDAVQMSAVGLLVANGYGMVIGHTAQITTAGIVAEAQILGTTYADSALVLGGFSTSQNSGIYMLRSRAAIGSQATVVSGDIIGTIDARADDGDDYSNGVSRIDLGVEGTVAANRTPGNIKFYTGADAAGSAVTLAMTIDSSQHVGIGTASPVGLLDVTGTTPVITIHDNKDGSWSLNDSYGKQDWYTSDGSDGAGVVASIEAIHTSAGPDASTYAGLRFLTGGRGGTLTEQMRIMNTGNVGIGTASPGSTLEINAADAGPIVRIHRTDTSIGANNGIGSIEWIGDEDGASDIVGTIQVASESAWGSNDQPTYMRFYTTPDSANVATEKMRITSAGNVGIGVTPEALFHVRSSDPGGATVNTNADEAIFEGSGNSGITIFSGATSNGAIYFGDSSSAAVGQIDYDHNTNFMTFVTSGSGKMTIDNLGLIGINETVNANMTVGLTINQGANDNQALALKSSDVNGGGGGAATWEGTVEDDTFFSIEKRHATHGGIKLRAYSGTGSSVGMVLQHTGGTPGTTKSTSGGAMVTILAEEVDGAGALNANVTANGNIFAVEARISSSNLTRFLVDEDGDMWSVTAGDTFDDYDDSALLDSYDAIRSDYRKWTEQEEDLLVKTGILGAPLSEGGMTCVTQLQRALVGNARQMASRMSLQQEEIESLKKELRLLKEAE